MSKSNRVRSRESVPGPLRVEKAFTADDVTPALEIAERLRRHTETVEDRHWVVTLLKRLSNAEVADGLNRMRPSKNATRDFWLTMDRKLNRHSEKVLAKRWELGSRRLAMIIRRYSQRCDALLALAPNHAELQKIVEQARRQHRDVTDANG